MTAYNINLAKGFVKTPRQRRRFYRGMILYVLLCSTLLIYLVYMAAINLTNTYESRKRRRMMINSTAASSLFYRDLFQDPKTAYADMKQYAEQIAALNDGLSGRVDFRPVIHLLLTDLPLTVQIESLDASAEGNKISFSLQVPITSSGSGDAVRGLLNEWNANEELMALINAVRPVTGERRNLGGENVFLVKFVCTLKQQE